MKMQSFLGTTLAVTCAVTLTACGGSTPHPENYTRNEVDDSACRTVYEPVCALAKDGNQYRYQTFGNRCAADLDSAEITFESECDALEDKVSEVSQPIVVHNTVTQLPSSSDATLLDSEISQNVAHLTLEHGGCPGANYRFELHVAPPFMESWPLQINARLTQQKQSEADCMALMRTDLSIDLLPLKNLYYMNYNSDTGEIFIPYAGLYQF